MQPLKHKAEFSTVSEVHFKGIPMLGGGGGGGRGDNSTFVG